MVQLGQARTRLERALGELARAAEALEIAPAAAALRAEAARLGASRFVLALVGERLAGKSTLANALLGNPLLPARAVPTTALLHEVSHGESPSAVLSGKEGSRPLSISDLGALSEGAPQLDRGARVLLTFPTEMLRGGVTLLDTPGTNDLSALGAEVTYGVLPEADAIVVVLDATQALRRTEIEFFKHRLPRSARDRTLVALNKSDLLGVSELKEARAYTERNLATILPGAAVFPLSAKLALERADPGVDKLRSTLTDLVSKERARLTLSRSVGEGLRLGEVLVGHLRLRREASQMAESELQGRLERIQKALARTRGAAHEACARIDARSAEIASLAEARLAEFTAGFEAALPGEIDRAEEGDLRRYLPFFLEDTLRAFTEGEAARIEEAMGVLAYEVLSELSEKGEEDPAALALAPGAAVRVEVDTTKYDLGVFAAGAIGMIYLFKAPPVGLLLLAGAPVLTYVLKDRVAGRVREVAKEQSVKALREARARLEASLREAIGEGASRIKERLLALGEESARGLELALEEALLHKRGGGRPFPVEIERDVHAAHEELTALAAELNEKD